MSSNSDFYAKSGVNTAWNMSWTGLIGKEVHKDRDKHGITHVGKIGSFAGALKLPPSLREKIVDVILENLKKKPTFDLFSAKSIIDFTLSSFSIVSCTDGVGTKTMIGERLKRLETLGYDLLAMNANDMVTGGAIPLAFLDYIGCKGIKDADGNYPYLPFIEGLIRACREVNVELVGGETAEMGANYTEFGSDLTGTAVGIMLDEWIPKKESIIKGDMVFGLVSSGIHSNGYSALRRVLSENNISLEDTPEGLEGKSVGDAALEPTRLYVNQALAANATGLVKGMAHITGGGVIENIERALPSWNKVALDGYWPTLPVFDWLGNYISHKDMFGTFNMGIGFTFITAPESYDALKVAVGEELYPIGEVI